MKLKTGVIIASALIVFVALSGCVDDTDLPAAELEDCGSDRDCINSAFENCNPAKYNNEDGTSIITGAAYKDFPDYNQKDLHVCVIELNYEGYDAKTCYVAMTALHSRALWMVTDGYRDGTKRDWFICE